MLVGSAVLIELKGDIFLCTAKHVLDECKKDQSFLYVCGPKELEPLPGDFRVSKDDDDTAVLQLPPEQMKRFLDAVPLNAESIANQVQAERCKYAEFIGFPETKNRRTVKRFQLERHLQCNGCVVKEITPEKVRLKFTQKNNIDATTRKRVMSPDLTA